jgi:hypothetical protein
MPVRLVNSIKGKNESSPPNTSRIDSALVTDITLPVDDSSAGAMSLLIGRFGFIM